MPNTTTERAEDGTGRRRGRLFTWLDRRARLDALLRTALDEPMPGGARFAFVFGSGLLFLFLSQFITGVFLALYYVPSADHAHTTVAYIVKVVGSGSFLRSMHAYGSSAIVVVLILHIGQTFLYGSYKGRRELLWLAGCVLGALMLGMAFTGYLLPWDQKAYFATAVGTNIMSEVPGVGELLKRFVRGGSDMGTLTLSRFFVAHVFLLPAAIFAMVAAHVYLFRAAGAAGPISEDPIEPTAKTEAFYPRQLAMDLAFAMVLVAAIGALAYVMPVELGPKANPADTQYFPRPEWYYRPAFEWLKFWEGSWSIVGVVVVPLLVVSLFAGVPFLDRRLERRPWKRPIAVGLFLAAFGVLVGLGVMSYVDDARAPGVAAQLAKQREEEVRFSNEPFEPEVVRPAVPAAVAAPAADPVLARGKSLFDEQSCSACHGEAGAGTEAGPRLAGTGATLGRERLEAILKNPTDRMLEGGMTPLDLPDEDARALVVYLESLK
jgi:ubiquinol-cytochrome c reductase cytochrome b subunit